MDAWSNFSDRMISNTVTAFKTYPIVSSNRIPRLSRDGGILFEFIVFSKEGNNDRQSVDRPSSSTMDTNVDIRQQMVLVLEYFDLVE